MHDPRDVALAGVLDPGDERPAARAALLDWLALQNAFALQPGVAAGRLRRSPSPRRALREPPAAPVPPARELAAARAALHAGGFVGVPFLSGAYPWRLANLVDPPPLLLVRGDVSALAAPSVAVVGARAASVYGRSVARELAAGLAAAGAVVVSGLARGIDAAAHRGALAAGGRTVAVLPCGPDRLYPPEHRRLADEIAARGAVVTELPLGTPPRRPLFALRNRVISGLARGVVVVEARRRSGSLITARHAADQGADVFAVPGPITAPTSEGPNLLLRDGAGVVLAAHDVLEPLGLATPPTARSAPAGGATAPRPEHRAICDALRREPLTRDALARRLARTPRSLAPQLLELELEGRVAEDRDGRLRVLRG